MKRILQMAVALALALGAALPATAAVLEPVYPLTSDYCVGGCGAPSYGKIRPRQFVPNVLQFQVVLDPNQFVQTGFPLTIGFNLVGNPTITYTFVSPGFSIPGGTSPTQSAGSFAMDGAGTFEYGLLGAGDGVRPIQAFFSISAPGLTLDSLEQNQAGLFFAVNIHSSWNGNTGVVAGSFLDALALPEPETYAMLLAGLGLMGFIARRRKRV